MPILFFFSFFIHLTVIAFYCHTSFFKFISNKLHVSEIINFQWDLNSHTLSLGTCVTRTALCQLSYKSQLVDIIQAIPMALSGNLMFSDFFFVFRNGTQLQCCTKYNKVIYMASDREHGSTTWWSTLHHKNVCICDRLHERYLFWTCWANAYL